VTPAKINLIVRNTKYPEAQEAAIGNPKSEISSNILVGMYIFIY
jgi:hypothetical protein